MSPIPQRFGIPTNEADFEKLCLRLLRHHWKRPQMQLYGKHGEEQTGVDIIDVGGEGKLYGGRLYPPCFGITALGIPPHGTTCSCTMLELDVAPP
ncbi:MAG TPA: hypothetical protein VK638_13120 [Edaphobacter sp.]|nr:hypothetical protein [Edaphobacter sp.]